MMAARPGTEISLRKSGGGVFEITVDGALRYSKRATGRFPTEDEVRAVVG
jgi:selT/selW/selH-like putative selenoprotein